MIYHVTTVDAWARASRDARYTPDAFAADGFIHCCDKEQFGYVLDRHFKGRQNLVILNIEPDRLDSPLQYEDLHGEGMTFPHIYGPLNLSAVEYYEQQRGTFCISTSTERIDLDAVHAFLSRAYWAENIPKDIVAKAITNSLCFGIYDDAKQIGFARIITDKATFAYLCDVYVLEEYRGRGLSRWLMEVVSAHPDLQRLRRFSLLTRDAHGLYSKFGFTSLQNSTGYMEILRPDIYRSQS